MHTKGDYLIRIVDQKPCFSPSKLRKMQEQLTHGPIPVKLAMLLCDMVITEQGTNKKTLIGIFDRLIVREFPTVRHMAIYTRLINAEGLYCFRVEFVHVDSDQVLGIAVSDLIEIADRLKPFDFALGTTITINEKGLYEFRLYANEAYIDRITFKAIQGPPLGG